MALLQFITYDICYANFASTEILKRHYILFAWIYQILHVGLKRLIDPGMSEKMAELHRQVGRKVLYNYPLSLLGRIIIIQGSIAE